LDPKDVELDALENELNTLKGSLHPPAHSHAKGAKAAPAVAVDPATILAIIDVVTKLIAWFRNRQQTP
jgi:hypothetical protein